MVDIVLDDQNLFARIGHVIMLIVLRVQFQNEPQLVCVIRIVVCIVGRSLRAFQICDASKLDRTYLFGDILAKEQTSLVRVLFA